MYLDGEEQEHQRQKRQEQHTSFPVVPLLRLHQCSYTPAFAFAMHSGLFGRRRWGLFVVRASCVVARECPQRHGKFPFLVSGGGGGVDGLIDFCISFQMV